MYKRQEQRRQANEERSKRFRQENEERSEKRREEELAREKERKQLARQKQLNAEQQREAKQRRKEEAQARQDADQIFRMEKKSTGIMADTTLRKADVYKRQPHACPGFSVEEKFLKHFSYHLRVHWSPASRPAFLLSSIKCSTPLPPSFHILKEKGCVCLEPVSYTHLDVYKRQ